MDTIKEYNNNKFHSSCNLIVIDNFYENPMEIRNFALTQEFNPAEYYPGIRTKSFANINIKNKIQNIIYPFGGKITDFNLYQGDNGSFQLATSYDRSWIHSDSNDTNWAGIIYLTPDAPLNSGTSFYKYVTGITDSNEKKITNTNLGDYSRDSSKWQLVDKVGNIFNRLVLFNSTKYHSSNDYFGTNLYDGRLFQVFFFKTEFTQ
jgi:hypothetical protein